MPKVKDRGIELAQELVKAADNLDLMRREDIFALLRITAVVLGEIVKEDPREPGDDPGSKAP
ncbi:hypothetical protein FJ987_22940 [Mesorhizobium sp. CU2]|uniref:hypothetical protein n=1 Tax=unclassified Mesorhizobium TaxID=325217 RepID=UPI00112A5DBE|nr:MULTISPECIES: hypothetical protein [unclassified Mesorhizobium]TPN75968.1 hypothetical protein FJ988_28630 [Mesorhizobium sp. CU3]TPO08861.1 hypothetical protein FJ987_22940 [Mesorhizobium sp. CU2]